MKPTESDQERERIAAFMDENQEIFARLVERLSDAAMSGDFVTIGLFVQIIERIIGTALTLARRVELMGGSVGSGATN